MANARAPSAGYSGTPLLKKLGYTSEQSAALVDAPKEVRSHLAAAKFKSLVDAPIDSCAALKGPLDAVHLFAVERAKLKRALPPLMKRLSPAGMIWVSWPKKAAKVATDITEDVYQTQRQRFGADHVFRNVGCDLRRLLRPGNPNHAGRRQSLH